MISALQFTPVHFGGRPKKQSSVQDTAQPDSSISTELPAGVKSALRLYEQEVTKTQLLTPKQVKELAEMIQPWQQAMAQLEKDPQVTIPNLSDLTRKGQTARNALVHGNLRLVFLFIHKDKAAQTALKQGYPLEDLIQAGNLGLIRAANKYDPHQKASFATYAMPWIRAFVDKQRRDDETIYRPQHIHEKRHAKKDSSRRPTAPHPEEAIHTARRKPGPKKAPINPEDYPAAVMVSAQTLLGESLTLEETLVSEQTGPQQQVANSQFVAYLDRILTGLPTRDRTTLKRFYGLGGQPENTSKALGKDEGVSHQAIDQRLSKIIAKLRADETLKTYWVESFETAGDND